jgi:hypothetical protein
MKTILLVTILSLTLFMIAACGKNIFETRPRIEIKSYSSKEIPQHGKLTIRLNYFDKEGDLGKGSFFAARRRLNGLPLGTGDADRADTLRYILPDFPVKDKGEIFLELNYDDFLKESVTKNDTIDFRIAVTDLAGNKSDTITSDKIVILIP